MTRIAPAPTEPVEATPRRKPSASARALLFAAYDGLCAMCGGNLPSSWVLDHLIPLELHGADDQSNFQPLCPDPCNKIKTRADAKAIAKIRRLIRKADPETRKSPQMRSRGFDKTLSRSFTGKTVKRSASLGGE